MSGFTQKYAIVQFFEDVSDGFEFPSSEWPLHATIVGTFAIDWDVPTMIKRLEELLANHAQANSVAEDDRLFGERQDIRVVLLKKTDSLMALHNDVMDVLQQGGCRPNEPHYNRQGFLPHATVQKHARLEKGKTVTFDALSIVDLFPNNDAYQRKVIKTITIGKQL